MSGVLSSARRGSRGRNTMALTIVSYCNPAVVRSPDKRLGVLVARIGLDACVRFGESRVLETFPLESLDWVYIAPFPWISDGQHRT